MKKYSIKFCTAEQAKSRARVMKMDEFITDDEIFGISEETFNDLNNLHPEITGSLDVVVEVITTHKDDTKHRWYIPKIFIDITEI